MIIGFIENLTIRCPHLLNNINKLNNNSKELKSKRTPTNILLLNKTNSTLKNHEEVMKIIEIKPNDFILQLARSTSNKDTFNNC